MNILEITLQKIALSFPLVAASSSRFQSGHSFILDVKLQAATIETAVPETNIYNGQVQHLHSGPHEDDVNFGNEFDFADSEGLGRHKVDHIMPQISMSENALFVPSTENILLGQLDEHE